MAKKQKELRPLSVSADALKAEIKKFCENNHYPNNAETSLLQTMDALRGNEQNCHRFLCPVDDYYMDKPVDFAKATSPKVYFSTTNSVAKKLEISNIPLAMTFYYCLLPHLKEKYDQKGYSEKLFLDTVDYLRSKLYEAYRVYGVWGTFDAPSFSKIFTLERFGFGRILYEVGKSPIAFEQNGKKISKGQKVLFVYPPTVDMPSKEEWLDSFAQAKEFFRDQLGDKVCFMLTSWMLYPVHRDFLKSDDPIVTIMDLFILVKEEKCRNNPDYWCIFNRFYKKDDKEDLFIENKLQEEYNKYIKAGNSMGRGTGVYFL